VRIEHLIVCERACVLSDGRPHALGIYAQDIPWRGDGTSIGIEFLLVARFEPDDVLPAELRAVFLDPAGKTLAATDFRPPLFNPFPGQETRGAVAGRLGSVAIPAPGVYRLILEGGSERLEWPEWPLRFVGGPEVVEGVEGSETTQRLDR
jgi:hypothetical protein